MAHRQGEGFRITGEKILASFGRRASHFFSTAKVSPDALDALVESFPAIAGDALDGREAVEGR